MSAPRKPGLLLAGAALLLLALPTVAFAQDDTARAQARALFEQGRAHFEHSRFDEALTAFEQANAIKPHPLMLYNIGQVYEAMADVPRAVETYERFLASGADDTGDVKDRLARLRRTLAASWTTLDLTSEPLGATVWVGDKAQRSRGRTPVRLQVPAGTVTLFLEKEGYRPVRRPVRLQAGKTEQLAIVLAPDRPVVHLTSTPPGARVSLGGAPVGVTPLVQPLLAGRHVVTIELEGRDPVVREFELTEAHTADQPLVIEAAFGEQVATGFLDVAIDATGVDVHVDGDKVGTTPLAGPIPLAPGAHRLELRSLGGPLHTETVIVVAGETARTRVELERAPDAGISQRTWGWMLMGVGGAVLAGGGVFGVMAASASGDLDDCRADRAGCNGTRREVSLADDVRSKALVTDVLVGGGVAVAAAGVVLWLLSDDEPGPGAARRSSFGVAPTPGGGAAAVGTFEF